MEDSIGDGRSTQKRERLGILASSPDIPGEKPILLGVPGLEEGTGEGCHDAVLVELDKVSPAARICVIGLSYDTTPTNTGKRRGTVARLQRTLDKSVLKLPCRCH